MAQHSRGFACCRGCGAAVLDGHITCGGFECDEHGERNHRADSESAMRRQFAAEVRTEFGERS